MRHAVKGPQVSGFDRISVDCPIARSTGNGFRRRDTKGRWLAVSEAGLVVFAAPEAIRCLAG